MLLYIVNYSNTLLRSERLVSKIVLFRKIIYIRLEFENMRPISLISGKINRRRDSC